VESATGLSAVASAKAEYDGYFAEKTVVDFLGHRLGTDLIGV
jgi:hypothetical protein